MAWCRLNYLKHSARKDGYAITKETYAPGLAAISAPIQPPGKGAVGVLAISGPIVRLTEEKMSGLAPELLEAARDIGRVSAVSPLFDRAFAAQEGARRT